MSTAIGRLAVIGILLLASARAVAAPERAVIGVWITDLYDLEPNSKSYGVRFWVWSVVRKDATIDPLGTMEFRHARSVTVGPPQVITVGDVTWKQREVRATFFTPWDVRSFPFDRHDLNFEMQDGLYDTTQLVYAVDTAQSGVDKEALPKTWHLTGFRAIETRYTFDTTFGDPSLTQQVSQYSQFEAHMLVRRNAVGIFFKLLLGAYVAFMMALLSFRIKTDQPTLFSARLGLLVGSLFATVVNLRSTEAVIGRSEHMTLVDEIHLTITIYVLLAAVAALVSRRHHDREKAQRALVVDRIAMVVFAVSFVAINVALILRAMAHA